MWEIPERVTEFVRKRIRSKAYREYIYRVGEELFPIDTTPKADVAQAREAEHRVFRMLRREGERALGSAEFSFRPIDPSIASHPYYTPPYYAPGLSPEEVYDGRGNLLAFLKGAGGGPAHKGGERPPPCFPPGRCRPARVYWAPSGSIPRP